MIKAVLLDFDGTMGDTSVTIMMSIKHTAKVLGLPPVDEEKVVRTTGLPLSETFRQALGIEAGTDQERAMEIYRDYFNSEGLKYVRMFPGVKESLDLLRDKGIALGVVTSRHMKSLLFLTEYLGIREHFSVMNTVDTVPNPKPAPDTVLACLSELGISASEAVVVGDTTFDLLMGHNAGCPACGVTYGNHTREMLETEHPEYLVDNLLDFCSAAGLC